MLTKVGHVYGLICKVMNVYVNLGKTRVKSVLILKMYVMHSAKSRKCNTLSYDLPSDGGQELLPPVVTMIFTWLVGEINFSSPLCSTYMKQNQKRI